MQEEFIRPEIKAYPGLLGFAFGQASGMALEMAMLFFLYRHSGSFFITMRLIFVGF